MNVLFLTLLDFESIDVHNIYTDLLREFTQNSHFVYIISPIEKRNTKNNYLLKLDRTTIIKPKIGNIQKTNIIEKGISTLLIESIFIKSIKEFFSDIQFDLVLYSTPPITFCNAIEFVKKRDGAQTYLLLKDIFPQNAVDIDMLSTGGIKGIIYRYFRRKEKKLYAISDYIGCMSQANVDYILRHNPEIKKEKVEICPNSIEVMDMSIDVSTREKIRKKYGIPIDRTVFVYGGNLGKPQGIDFLLECLKKVSDNNDTFFFLVGDGTEYKKIQEYIVINKLKNVKLMKRLPKEDYDIMVAACDVGMIFLDHRFTIPNFPSRLLGYMQARIPVLAVTDCNTDIGKIIINGGFGWWCISNSVEQFNKIVEQAVAEDSSKMKKLEFKYLQDNYNVKDGYKMIISHFQGIYL